MLTDWVGYSGKYLKIGGKYLNGRWQWDSNIRKDIVVADWHPSQPNGSNAECIGIYQGLQWDDGECSHATYFICEKSQNDH